jgi:hypothetical protein
MIKPIEKFTPSQEVGLDKIQKFLNKPITRDINSRVFVLTGMAGTGKTTLIRYAFEKELQQDFNTINKKEVGNDMFNLPNIMGVALSHKAKNVLSQSIHICKTFASTFGLKQTYGQNGEVIFMKMPKKNFETYPCELPLRAFVHDECSMYDMSMLKYVLDDTNHNSKIIFMGDAGQLPPISSVGDEDSPVFTLDLSEDNKHELTERVRQTDENPILALSDILYKEIFSTQNLAHVLECLKTDSIVNNCGHMTLSYSQFLADYKSISADYTDTKVVAYRNNRVTEFNNAIRNYVHNKPDRLFIDHEIIYMNDTFTKEKKMGNKKLVEYICYNSDEYMIELVGEDVIDGIKCYILMIKTEGHSHLLDCDNVFIPVVMQSSRSEFNSRSSSLAHFAKTAEPQNKALKWKNFYDYKNQFGDVAYGYCYTGHKIQGSGYKNIYVDVNDIVTVGPISDKRKIQAIYTGMTRATHLVKFLKA